MYSATDITNLRNIYINKYSQMQPYFPLVLQEDCLPLLLQDNFSYYYCATDSTMVGSLVY